MKARLDDSLLIGIDGLAGSGKTTYARALQEQLKDVKLFHLDDFIHKKEIRYNVDFEEWYCYYHLQWRYDELIRKLLWPLKNGVAVNDTIELYDKETDSYTIQKIDIPIGTTVIVEGVFLQRPELRLFFDTVIYLDVDKKTRLKRVLDRDTYIGSKEDIMLKYKNRYFPAEDVYVELCNPLSLADGIENEVGD
jgi:uridine kinase